MPKRNKKLKNTKKFDANADKIPRWLQNHIDRREECIQDLEKEIERLKKRLEEQKPTTPAPGVRNFSAVVKRAVATIPKKVRRQDPESIDRNDFDDLADTLIDLAEVAEYSLAPELIKIVWDRAQDQINEAFLGHQIGKVIGKKKGPKWIRKFFAIWTGKE